MEVSTLVCGSTSGSVDLDVWKYKWKCRPWCVEVQVEVSALMCGSTSGSVDLGVWRHKWTCRPWCVEVQVEVSTLVCGSTSAVSYTHLTLPTTAEV